MKTIIYLILCCITLSGCFSTVRGTTQDFHKKENETSYNAIIKGAGCDEAGVFLEIDNDNFYKYMSNGQIDSYSIVSILLDPRNECYANISINYITKKNSVSIIYKKENGVRDSIFLNGNFQVNKEIGIAVHPVILPATFRSVKSESSITYVGRAFFGCLKIPFGLFFDIISSPIQVYFYSDHPGNHDGF